MGVLDMSELKKHAESVVYYLADDVAAFVMDQAQVRLVSLQTAAHSIDLRATQVAALQFAAAGVVSTLWAANVLSIFCALASVCFAIGGIMALSAVRPGEFQPPGMPPAWWENFSTEGNLDAARAWAAGCYQEAIDHTCKENERRGRAIERSLNAAAAAGVIISVIGFFSIFVPR